MIYQINNPLWFKLNGLLRYLLVHTSSELLPLYIVNEFPKSGGSWVGEMLAEAFGLPFPRNRLPLFSSSIIHGHFMHSWNMHKPILVWRDGRDVLISLYFHSLFKNERGNSLVVDYCRSDLCFDDYHDIKGNLIPFMEYVFESKRNPRFSWSDFVDNWVNKHGCIHVRYEDLRIKPIDELKRLYLETLGKPLSTSRAELIVDNHSFKRMSGRDSGKENVNSFMRKGIVGDWKNYFDFESSKRFHEYAGKQLIRLGYEKDDSWVNEAAKSNAE